MQRKKKSKRIEMIIKMVNEFKFTGVHFARPNQMRICTCVWIYRSSGKKIIIIIIIIITQTIVILKRQATWTHVKSRCVVWTDDGNLSNMHLSMLSRRGRGGGRAWGGHLTFFKNFAVKFLPTGKSFQSIATKFPHPGLHIAVKYPKAERNKCTIKISPSKLKLRNLYL